MYVAQKLSTLLGIGSYASAATIDTQNDKEIDPMVQYDTRNDPEDSRRRIAIPSEIC